MVENAFGRLKARWRCLSKRIDVNYKLVPKVIAVCCTLHNIVAHENEIFQNQWLNAIEGSENIYEQPEDQINPLIEISQSETRQVLTNYLADNFPLRQSRIH